MAPRIDLNCDLGEGYGAWQMGEDEAVLPFISSASIACGFHAGDPVLMRRTVRLALAHGVALGAHVSFPDLQGFGRREMTLAPAEVEALVLYQVGALAAIAAAEGARLAHVKPHGALYNMAARDAALAAAIAAGVRGADPALRLYGLAGSELLAAGRAAGLAVVAEGYCDRRYEADGRLASRSLPGAVLEDADEAAAQAVSIATGAGVIARDGTRIAVGAESLCVHGDRPDAAAFAQRLSEALGAAGIDVRAPGR